MDLKTIITDINQAIITQWGSLEKCRQAALILNTHRQLLDARETLKTLKNDKNLIAKQFKDAKDDAEKLAALKVAMQANSASLKEVQIHSKTLENTLLDFFADTTKEAPSLPERFTFTLPQHADDDEAVTIALLNESGYAQWDAYVQQHPKSTPYHCIAWKHIIEDSFGHTSHYLVAYSKRSDGQNNDSHNNHDHNNIVGVLPITELSSKLFGHFAVSIPFVNYGGPLANSVAIAKQLVDYASKLPALRPCSHIELRLCEAILNLPANTKKVSMILSLPDSSEQLDQQLGAKVRAQFNQAAKHNVSVAFGREELLTDFYHVFARNMRDLGTPVYSKTLFANILRRDKNSWLCVVYLSGKPAGTAFLCGHKTMLEIPWASTIKTYNAMNINMWMYRQILGFAIEKGFSYFDFGRSTKDAGTYKFKKQWGAKPVQHHWYYVLPEGESLPEINPDNPKYKLAIAVWQCIPVFVTKIIGPHIVKFLG